MSQQMNNAEKHAKIAKAVWPDVEASTTLHNVLDGEPTDCCMLCIPFNYRPFNLLATKDGASTKQALDDALDVKQWLKVDWSYIHRHRAQNESTCAAIFNAAWEVVKDDH